MRPMNILLLQGSVYFPSYGGGNKANRYLLEALAERGHRCSALAKSVDAQQVLDRTSEAAHLSQRGIQTQRLSSSVLQYSYRGVSVYTVNLRSGSSLLAAASQLMAQSNYDLILVSDDKDGQLLDFALKRAPRRTIAIMHTNMHLPFGDEAQQASPERTRLYQDCPHLLCSTAYIQTYLMQHAGLAAVYLPFPVFGPGPFQSVARFQRGAVGMINPCAMKGIDIFLALAPLFPQQEFIAVPTWGASEADQERLAALQNIRIVAAADEIEHILRQLTVLLVPSLIAETFGYVVVEAMLRGIPVLASDHAGLRDAKLGVDYLLPITPASRQTGEWFIPPQQVQPWAEALTALLHDEQIYRRCSQASWQAANDFASSIDVTAFEQYFAAVLA